MHLSQNNGHYILMYSDVLIVLMLDMVNPHVTGCA